MQATLTKFDSFSGEKIETEEQVLLKHLSSGDRTAFWKLWMHYQDYLFCRCRVWMGGNLADAEEALSRAMLKALKKLPVYAEKITNLKAWLARMVHNLCIDMHRERQRSARGIESIEAIAEREDETRLSSPHTPESAILRRELAMYLRRAIDALSIRLRSPFLLRFCQKMSYADIAKQLATSVANIRKRIQQARAILQKQLNKYFAGLGDSNWKTFQGDELTTSNSHASKTIDYRITASCLEILPPTWYNFSNPLGWN
jgi:RNA polymerase sigma factor (sigma-70 family)